MKKSIDTKTNLLVEMNSIARLMRRNGYSFRDNGRHLVVDDPVYRVQDGMLVLDSYTQVSIHKCEQAIKFISDRS